MQTLVGNVVIEFEVLGDRANPAVLLVHGLGAQLTAWDEAFCQRFIDAGYCVIRFDNRDVGLSSKVPFPADLDIPSEVLRGLAGEPITSPYTLADMAADAVGVLDACNISRAHVLGVSMGGMIVQQMAIQAPSRVATLTSIMSTTGDLDVGYADPAVLAALMASPPPGRDAAIANSVAVSEMIASPGLFDEVRARRVAALAYDRCFFPEGVGQQGLAIVASGSRFEELGGVQVPTLVIHGDADPLVHWSGGERTAAAIPNAELLLVPGMAHDLPELLWPRVVGAICDHVARVAV
ncbi:MAG: alpha/beta fold hydrolase [Acidimicrobiia bacterium]